VKTIIITGCAGLIGSHFSRHLLKYGYKVVGIDDLSGGYEEYLPNNEDGQFEFWPVNLSDDSCISTLEHIFTDSRRNIKACYHFAAYAAEGLSPFIRNFNYKNNIISSANVINTCINFGIKLIFTSSMAVYGDQSPPFNENMTQRPIDPYGIAKYAIEMDIKVAGEQHGLRYNIVRPHNVVGIYQNIWDRYRNVVGIFIRRVIDGQPILVYGDGNQTRAFSDIKYYMTPFEQMIDSHDGEVFNIGADKSYTINELANIVCEIGKENRYNASIQHVEPRHEAKHAFCDHTKAKNYLNFNDNTNLSQLVEEMFKWALTQPKRQQKSMNYEIKKGIYDYWK